jgi:hypothetical protein
MGPHLAATRMYATLPQIIRGWARIYSTTNQRRIGRIVAALVFFLVSALSAYPAFVAGVVREVTIGEHHWLIASLLHLALMTVYLFAIYRHAGNRGRYALLLPLSGPIMLWTFARATWLCRTGRMNWRGTSFLYVPGAGSSLSSPCADVASPPDISPTVIQREPKATGGSGVDG